MFKLFKLSILLLLVSCSSTKTTTENTSPVPPPPPEPKVEKIYATVDDNGYLVGVADMEHFFQEPFNVWFTEAYDNYIPNPAVIEDIKPLLAEDITIKAFMGTWCGDSRREVPHFYKILSETNFDFGKLTMVAVDRQKTAPRHEQEGLNIMYVPTFIFYKNGVEINRIVEYPQDSLERDILSILKEEGYKNSYYEG